MEHVQNASYSIYCDELEEKKMCGIEWMSGEGETEEIFCVICDYGEAEMKIK